ncbi:MAG: hypothetical protein ISP90_02605 [Nevskia sp.]|nr:hypothetical protein [Nevskia sp.]
MRKKSRISTISWFGVLAGGLADLTASTLLNLPIGVYLLWRLRATAAPAEIPRLMSQALLENPPLYLLQLLVGVGSTVLGGYVAARIARRKELLHGVLAAAASFALSGYSILEGTSGDPLAVQFVLLALTPLFGLLGGWLYRREKAQGLFALA